MSCPLVYLKMGDFLSTFVLLIGGILSVRYRYLIRYISDERVLCIDFCTRPTLFPEQTVVAKVRRVCRSYVFFTWEDWRSNIVSAEFNFTDALFSDELRAFEQDIEELSRLCKCPNLGVEQLLGTMEATHALLLGDDNHDVSQ